MQLPHFSPCFIQIWFVATVTSIPDNWPLVDVVNELFHIHISHHNGVTIGVSSSSSLPTPTLLLSFLFYWRRRIFFLRAKLFSAISLHVRTRAQTVYIVYIVYFAKFLKLQTLYGNSNNNNTQPPQHNSTEIIFTRRR